MSAAKRPPSNDEHTPLLPLSVAKTSVGKSESMERLHADLRRNVKKQTRGRKSVGAFRRKIRDAKTWTGRVGVHVEVDSIDIGTMRDSIVGSLPGWELTDRYDAIRLWHPMEEDFHSGGSGVEDNEGDGVGQFDAGTPEVYIFSFGAVVFWNFGSEDSEQVWMQKHVFSVDEACGERHQIDAIDNAADQIEFCYNNKSKFHRDVAYLSTKEPGEKLAVSYGFAKSALLSIFEWKLERAIKRNSAIPEELATSGHIKLNRTEIFKEIGRIYLVKQEINLENSIQDVPEEFWEDDRFYEQYNRAMNYFDITSRLDLVNSRLDILQDLHQVLSEAAQNHHAVQLEWIVIILIVFEVVVEFFRYLQEGK